MAILVVGAHVLDATNTSYKNGSLCTNSNILKFSLFFLITDQQGATEMIDVHEDDSWTHLGIHIDQS